MDAVTRLNGLLPAALREMLGALPDDLTELRLRAGKPVHLVRMNGEELVGGGVGAALIQAAAQALAGHSLYAREEELREGYFTIEGGCRVGVCGRMTAEEGKIIALTHVGSICVRIAREVKGAADGVMKRMYEAGRPVSALVVSPPGLGKTTLLRDLARQLSDGTGGQAGVRVGIADERGELAGCRMGIPTLDVGVRTDVMDGCPKRTGMRLLVRAMSPEVIVTDELGHPEDAAAVQEAMRCGVRVIASVHAADEEEAESRLGSGLYGLFGRVIVLGGEIGQVRRIIGGEADGYGSAAGCGVRDDGGERVGRQTDGGCAGKTGAGAPGDRFRREAAGN